MQPINVAVADVNQQKREAMEHFLQQGRRDLAVLMDVLSKQDERVKERRLKSRENITLIEDNLARINRLKPQVLFVNAQYFLAADCMFFVLLRRQCPEILVILLTDETTKENEIMKGLANGVCGFLSHKSDLVDFIKATKAVEHGEAWVPRKLHGEIMREILYTSHKIS
jgi:DNA-binding NarL/FixJ family response regulator